MTVNHRAPAILLDDALVVRANSGDLDALDHLYVRHRDDLIAYLRSRVGCPDLAEDLASETFVRAFAGLDRYRQGNFAAWLFRIGRNLAVDHHRRGPRSRELPVGEMWADAAADPDPGPESTIVDRIEVDGWSRSVQRALPWLTSDQRTCLQLRFYEERTIAETADAMQRSPGAVRVLQNRAVRALGERVRAEQRER